jgi:hypothetical protein
MVADSAADSRFKDNPLVTQEPHNRFYAGAPLEVADGLRLGTLCVIDRKPRSLTHDQLEALTTLRDAVVNLLELRRLRADRDTSEPALSMCAWCQRVRLGDPPSAKWTAAHAYLTTTHRVSHSICPRCRSEWSDTDSPTELP